MRWLLLLLATAALAADTLWVDAGRHDFVLKDLPDGSVVIGKGYTEITGGVRVESGHVEFHNLQIHGGPLGVAASIVYPGSATFIDCEFSDGGWEWDAEAVKGWTPCPVVASGSLRMERCRIHHSNTHLTYIMPTKDGQLGDMTFLSCEFIGDGQLKGIDGRNKYGIHMNRENRPKPVAQILVDGCTFRGLYGGIVQALCDGVIIQQSQFIDCNRGIWVGYKPTEKTRIRLNQFVDCGTGILANEQTLLEGNTFDGCRVEVLFK